jgi:AcrR family transcriptional regulator
VLARDGLAGCTARAVAEASPLTKSAIHYYFRHIDEIADLAMAAHVGAMLASLREVARQHTDPERRLHAVLQAYLDTFADKPYAAFLWFEYWIAAGRREATGPVQRMLDDVHGLLAELLAGLPAAGAAHSADEVGATANSLLSWLLGSIVQQHIRPQPAAALHTEISRFLASLPQRPWPQTLRWRRKRSPGRSGRRYCDLTQVRTAGGHFRPGGGRRCGIQP